MKRYFIKENYKANQIPITSEEYSDGLYWTKDRIKASRLYQYSVYMDAIDVAKEYGIKKLCDVGCGTGEKLRHLHAAMPSLNIVGIDQNHAIDYCLKRHDFGSWLVDNFSNPKLSIDANMTICSDVIEHLVDPDILLNYLKQITIPGGLILISTPDRDRLHGVNCLTSPNKQHIREWNGSEFKKYLESHGLIVLRHYHAPAVKFSISRAFINEVVKRLLNAQSVNYNQIALLRNPG